MRSYGWALMQRNLSFYKKRVLEHRHAFTEESSCEETMRRQLSANQGERPQQKRSCQHLELRLWLPELWEKFLLFKLPSWWYFVMKANKLIQMVYPYSQKNYAGKLAPQQSSYVTLATLFELSNAWVLKGE